MSYEDRIKAISASAQSRFNNANGPQQSEYSNFANTGGQELDHFDSTLSVDISLIATSASGKARIFGSTLGLDENYNTANNTTVSVPESSHLQIKTQLLAGSMRIQGISYEASSTAQLNKPLSISEKQPTGSLMTKLFQATKYKDPKNYSLLFIKTEEFQMVVNATNYIDIDVVAGATISIVFNISEKIDPGAALNGKSSVQSKNPFSSFRGY